MNNRVAKPKQRIAWLDFAKGVTIFLVVFVHVIEGLYKTGQFPAYQVFSEMTMGLLFTVVMPVFFALSGFVYSPPKNVKHYFASLLKKLVSLGVPYVVFSIIYVAMQHVAADVHHLNSWQDLAHIYAMPIGYLWYLYVLFFVFAFVGMLSLLRLSMFSQMCIYLAGLVLVISQTIVLPYVISSLLMWTSSFYLGYIFKQHPHWLNHRVVYYVSGLVFVASLIWQMQQGGQWFETDMMNITDVFSKFASIPVFLYLYQKTPQGKLTNNLTTCGRYSLIIYLVHAPMASIGRVLLLKVGLHQYIALVILILIFAWATSLLVVYMTKKIPMLSLIFNPLGYARLK